MKVKSCWFFSRFRYNINQILVSGFNLKVLNYGANLFIVAKKCFLIQLWNQDFVASPWISPINKSYWFFRFRHSVLMIACSKTQILQVDVGNCYHCVGAICNQELKTSTWILSFHKNYWFFLDFAILYSWSHAWRFRFESECLK